MNTKTTMPAAGPTRVTQPHRSRSSTKLLLTALAMATLPCLGAVIKVTEASELNTFLVAGPQEQVSATFDFKAHPPKSETVNGVVEIQVQPTLTLKKQFTDKHKTVGGGEAKYAIFAPRAGNLKHRLTEQVDATVLPNCSENRKDCGDVSMTTTTERKVTITATSSEPTRALALDVPNDPPSTAFFDFALDVGLGAGTSTSLGAVQKLSESVRLIDSDSPQSIYDLEFGVRLDLNQEQEVYVNFVAGTVSGLIFDREISEIRSQLLEAFTYNGQLDQWDILNDTPLFSAHLTTASESLQLIGGVSDYDPGVEVRTPDATSTVGLLLWGILGCRAFKELATRRG